MADDAQLCEQCGTAVTRQELAAILYRYNNYRGLSNGNLSNLSQFTDRGYVQSYAKEAMQWAVGNGIISGTTNGTTAVTDYSTLPEGIWSGDVSVQFDATWTS